jgi:hypothetical protein
MKGAKPDSHLIATIASAALGGAISAVEPVTDGRSTRIYRFIRGAEVFYARVLPEEGASFAPEAAAHLALRRRGVNVPDVVYWEDLNPLVGRSVMITTAISGQAIAHSPTPGALSRIARSAGCDLALLNALHVDGFGWINRALPADSELRADLPTERAFMLAELDSSLATLRSVALTPCQTDDIRSAVSGHEAQLDATHARLAHGDFDATHIFSHRGNYTGIIDLGEIRGASLYYDIVHFRFHDGETLPVMLLPYLLEGYQEISTLTPDAEWRLALASLLIGVRFLARTHGRLSQRNHQHALAAITREVTFLTP